MPPHKILRKLFFKENLESVIKDDDDQISPGVEVDSLDEANLISSQTNVPNIHLPAIDIDVPCQLVPSKTPGHYHLYFDVPVTTEVYSSLLKAMVASGIVEPNYYKHFLKKNMTQLRTKPEQKNLLSSYQLPTAVKQLMSAEKTSTGRYLTALQSAASLFDSQGNLAVKTPSNSIS